MVGSSVTGTSVWKKKNHPFLTYSLWVVLVSLLEFDIFRQAWEKTKAKIRMSASSLLLCLYLNVEKYNSVGTWDLWATEPWTGTEILWEMSGKPRSNQCASAGKPNLSYLQGIVCHAPCATCIQRLISSTLQKNQWFFFLRGPNSCPFVFVSLTRFQKSPVKQEQTV